MVRFTTVVELGGKTATGLPVPADVIEVLGAGKRVPVVVELGGHSYRTTVAPMSGRFFVPLSAENRTAAGVAAGDQVEVGITVDTAPREVDVPPDLAAAMAADDQVVAYFATLSFTHRKEWVRWVEEAKRPETRAARIAKTVEGLRAGRREH